MRRSTNIEISVVGDREFGRELFGLETRAINCRPAFESILEMLREWARGQYMTHGARSGEVWKPISAVYAAAKLRRGLDPRLMLATHDLYNSLAHHSKDSIDTITDDELKYGSKVKNSDGDGYFKYHQSRKPRKKLPRRAITGMTALDKEQIVNAFRSHIVALRRSRL